ncbi:MAG: hypothetical protein K6E50_10590 [Lachnospiraceae bacterium]|nr:hypothetical protein [Lachnospiraceae bacterium]
MKKRKLASVLTAFLFMFALVSALSTLRVQAEPEVMPDGTLFDAEFYAKAYPDVVAVYGTTDPAVMYKHYRQYGKKEGRLPYAPAGGVSWNMISVSQNIHAVSENGMSAATLEDYFRESAFVGDSVMSGYKLYLARHKESPASQAVFLSSTSYATYHALKEKNNLHPAYQGVSQPVWKSIAQMGAKRVFIMLGTNDLVCFDAKRTADGIFNLVERIRQECPGVEINLISMVPVYGGASKGCLNNKGVDALNIILRQGCEQHYTGFVELNTFLKNDKGALRNDYCSDKLVHETTPAYSDVWDLRMRGFAEEAQTQKKDK